MTLFLFAAALLLVLVLYAVLRPLLGRSPRVAAAVAAIVVAGSTALYLQYGTPDALDPTMVRAPETLAEARTQLERKLADSPEDAEGWRLDSVCLGLIRGCGHGSPEQRSGPQLSQRPRHGKRGRLTKGCLEVQLRRCRMAVGQRHAALKVSARSMYSRHHIILSDSFLHLIARQRSRQSVTLGRDSPAGK